MATKSTYMRAYLGTIGKNYYWWGTKDGGYGFGEWRFFWWRSMSIHVHLYTHIYFLHIMYLFLFSKKLLTNIIRLSTKNIYFKLWKFRAKFCANCATFPSRNFLFQWAWNISNSNYLKQWKFWVVNKWEVPEKCKS